MITLKVAVFIKETSYTVRHLNFVDRQVNFYGQVSSYWKKKEVLKENDIFTISCLIFLRSIIVDWSFPIFIEFRKNSLDGKSFYMEILNGNDIQYFYVALLLLTRFTLCFIYLGDLSQKVNPSLVPLRC